jgi:1,4-dihydroxy-2-naphthoyl-CoA hydrolase
MLVTAELLQPAGILHGGGNIVLAETLGSVAAVLCVDRELYRCVGQEVNANHLRPALLGAVLTGTARAIHIGARSQVWSIEIRDERDRLTCISRLTMAVIDLRPG